MGAIPAPSSSNDVPDAFISAVCRKCLPLQTVLVCDNQYRLPAVAIKYGSACVPAPDGASATGAWLAMAWLPKPSMMRARSRRRCRDTA